MLEERKICLLERDLKNKSVFMVVMITSLVLTIVFIPLAFEDVWQPFVIALALYAGSSCIAACAYTPLGRFFNWTVPVGSGATGCLTAVIYMFVWPTMAFISCFGFVGFIALFKQISKIKDEIKVLENQRKTDAEN